ncbi:uncharacterized protein E(y)3 isoform X2 [Anoplolepis gracilipes]|uniref:uncharacterized protein E(y)3 isoform X2 n=1 Tax=Anoplolepis gracilipes TaxID=354296 RepID=UPI003B9E092D
MSEGSKMGLFGSKDRNQEQKEKSSKDNSPARYAPYGIDSDTETYDTEALSMMDINDIIGVQSGEQVGDSTLESEIAALSQIITDSKMESTSQLTDTKLETQQGASKNVPSSTSDAVHATDIDNIDISNADESSIMSKKCAAGEVYETQNTTLDRKDTTCEKLSSITTEKNVLENTEMDSAITCDKTSDINIDKIISDTSAVCVSESSSNDMSCIEINSSTVTLDETSQETVQSKQIEDAASPKSYEKDIVENVKEHAVDETNESQKNNTKSVVTVGGISKSLQLIGEAYNSEDSEETDLNDSDFFKETVSLSQETLLLGVSTIEEQEKKIIEENSKVIDVSEQNTEKSLQLNDNVSATISEESKIEDIIDSGIKNADQSIERSEDFNPSNVLQQTLEVQANIDDSELNKGAEFDSTISSGIQKQNENDTEIDETNTTEEMSLELQSSNETSQETIETFANTSTSPPLLEIVNTECGIVNIDNEEIKIKNIDPKLNISVPSPVIEKQDSLISNEKELDTKIINDNCPLIDDDDDVKDDIKDVSKYKDKDTLLESACENQDSVITKVSDKKLSMTEAISKNDDSKEENAIIESCQTTREITSETNEINAESQEAVIKMDVASTVSDNQVKDLTNAEETCTLNDKNIFQTASSIINEELVFNENTSSNQSHVEEKNLMTNEQSCGDLLGDKNSDLYSADPITQSDINSINVNNSMETIIRTEENLLALESLIPVKHDEPVEQLPSILETPKTRDVNDTVSNKLEDLPAPVSHEDSNSTIDININESLHQAEKIEDVEMKISEVSLSVKKNQSETPMETNNKPQQICDQSESHISDEISDSCANNSTLQIKEYNVTSPLCNTLTGKEDDKIEKDVTIEISNEKEIRGNETFVPNLKEKDVIEPEESTEAETHDISLVLESDISKSEAGAANPKDVNLHGNEEIKPCDETAKVLKKESEELVDVNVTPIVEEKSVEPIVEKSINDNDVQSSIINIINMSLENSKETNAENLTEKLSQDSESVDAPIVAETTNTLEGLLSLNLISDNESSTLKDTQTEGKTLIEETVSKDVDIDLLFDRSNQSETTMTENSDSITNVIASCLTNRDDETSGIDINVAANDKPSENEDNISLTNKDAIVEPVNEITDEKLIKESLGADSNLLQNELDIDFEDTRLESVEDLEENEAKLELPQDILLESVMPRENLSRNVDTPIVIENSQSSSEISELESAVKFLQESEEQTIDSPLVLSPKMVESVVEDITKQANAELYVSDEIDNYASAESELANLRNVTATDSISISEAEIISEAAKLENERKFSQIRNVPNTEEKDAKEINEEIKPKEEMENRTCLTKTLSENVSPARTDTSLSVQMESMHEEKNATRDIRSLSSEDILKAREILPRVSILEERLKEPPKIEIPVSDSVKLLESSISPNNSLLIPKDARAIAYSRMLESPKSTDKIESKSVDTPRKDLEKHSDLENVGSPRIILKIAKSAIADCSEPRSPKSPKIRSATNSPNPEDSPGQKLGKIKLKLSKSGHPSIISNENLEEINQWHTTESAPSLSPLGMKIKLSKSGDASIVGSEKHELDETKYKIEEPKRTDSPIGMKIKLSKSGDASIISDSTGIRQQDCTKEVLTKHKEKLEIPQGSPKRTESPIGMKIKLSKSGDASIIQTDRQESSEEVHREVPKRTDSPIGMKIKLSKTGDASIVSPDTCEDTKDSSTNTKEKQDNLELPKRTESPIGMKIKLTKCKGGASIISVDNTEDTKDKLEVPEPPKRTESPLGMKIKLLKTGDASIIHSEVMDDGKETRHKEKSEVTQDTIKSSESLGLKLKMLKTGEMTSSILSDMIEEQDVSRSSESFVGVIPKIKVSKSGDSLMMLDKTEPTEDSPSQEDQQVDQQASAPKRTESPLGMKIKLSKSGDASIVQSETVSEDQQNKTIPRVTDTEYSKSGESSLGMKIKLFKTGDASVVEAPPSGTAEKKDKQQRRRDAVDSPLEIKIKLSKTGHPTIVACDSHGESSAHRGKDPPQAALDSALNFPHTRYVEQKESALKILKTGHHPSILQGSRTELTIEPVQSRKQTENVQQQIEISPKRKDITISPVENKKSKLEAQLSQILPEVTIQPVMCRDQKQQQQQLLFDPKSSLISRQQMNVINQEISITQVRPTTKADTNVSSVNDKLKDLLCKNTTNSPGGSSDCEIIEHRPELIIVNENSNSSQDVVIIEEVTPSKTADIKVPKKRGRPRRNPIVAQQQLQLQQSSAQLLIPKDPLALDEVQQIPPQQFEHRENERPKRTCRNQKSYAPPKRGRGRGRGKRKLDNVEPQVGKKSRIDQDLSAIEASTMAVITIDETTPVQPDPLRKSSELYKALKQPPIDRKNAACKEKHIALASRKETGKRDSTFKDSESDIAILDPARLSYVQEDPAQTSTSQTSTIGSLASKAGEQHKRTVLEIVSEKTQKTTMKQYAENKGVGKASEAGSSKASEIKEVPVPPPGHSNWLTPTSKKQVDSTAIRGETVSTVQVIDEETRMSAESGSRSQTPARNISAPASETITNEESQGSVLSTATTESEKVKVKNRRMEINFDPDEGPFTVDKIAEYEWPLDRKGETFMIQEQISQYLGVKSFKRKYPDLKRRVVDMEERNYLRENGLVSEGMCDMGLTAVCSSEVLDVMCSDFPDQYEEYRKHMREKQVKEHSKKQKELTAAANAERNRIDLAEMAVQSAFAWNSNLNKARKENRKCCLDLQTFTIHVPKKQQKVDPEHKVGHYPVALIPGQYTDYYREYTPAELRYYPLNTVLYGPTRPNERKCDSQSEGSQSDSDSESSSDDSSSSSSEGTQDTEGSQSTMDDVDMEISNSKDDVKLKCKMCLKVLNKHNKNEILIQCGTCNGNVHPSCIDLTLDMVPHIQSYAWQCTDCKTCAQCHDPADEDKMLFCDMCDRGYHIYCVGLRRVPQGRWHCQECAVCANCGSREAGGANSDRNSVAQWQHEYKKGEKNTRVYVSTLCVPCSKLWRKGRYCPHCSRCHTAQRLDLEANLVHCSACDKYLHLECVETKGLVVDKKSYLCDFCTPSTSQQVTKPLVSKMLKT